MTIFDTHCHIDGAEFDADRDEMLDRARAAGVAGVVCIGAGQGLGAAPRAVALAERHPDVWATVGVHPHDAAKVSDGAIDEVRALAAHTRVVAIGECGLDYHYDHSPRDVQRRRFAQQVALARALGLPLSVHTREADEDTISVLRAEGTRGPGAVVGGVIHCFTHAWEFGRDALDLGLWLSIPGVVTFKKSEALRDVVRRLPLDRLVLESDAPYLSPVPHRGKRNEPAFVAATAACVAAASGRPLDEVARTTTANARALYRLDAG